MRTHLVPIGNSRGVRIPKAILQACGITDGVDLAVENQQIVIRAVRAPRAGWAAAASTMAERGEDRLLDVDTPTAFDQTEWEW